MNEGHLVTSALEKFSEKREQIEIKAWQSKISCP